MKKIIFIGGVFDESNSKYIVDHSSGVIQNAADALQKSLIKGLAYYFPETLVINLPFIGSYPKFFNKFYFNIKNSEVFGIPVLNVPFWNLKGYKLFSRFLNLFAGILKYNNCIFIVYSINMPFILAVYLKKVLGKNNQFILVVPDLPEFMNNKTSFFKSLLLKVQDFVLKKIIFKNIDGFVLLTEAMNERLLQDKSKLVVVEGIFVKTDSPNKNQDNQNVEKFSVLYTGTLDIRYGILDLLNQFTKIKNNELELLICGAGDDYALSSINAVMDKDSRIKFLGQLLREDVLILQEKASLLINPRKPEEFTKFSFPSKTMEYFASGVPVLMYRLDGVPNEYYNYCYELDQDNPNTIHDEILRIFSISKDERVEMGMQAKNFILLEKNEINQVKKIKDLLETISN